MKTYEDAFDYVTDAKVEGSLSMDPKDSGNWTGGEQDFGQLKGTKYGISAASYPNEDIANLTLDRARFLFKRDFWDKLGGDFLPWGVALCLFDFAVNAGIRQSVRTAQRALGIMPDGIKGPITTARLQRVDIDKFAALFTAYRIAAYHQMPGFAHEGEGWIARANRTQEVATS